MTEQVCTGPSGRWPRLGAVLGAGLGIGVGTSYLQGALPDPVNFLANSGAVWAVLAMLLAAWGSRDLQFAVGAGTLAALGEVVGYYAIASPLRHVATTNAERALWLAAALVIGPVVGVASHFARCGSPAQRMAAFAAACGVVAGEGVYAVGYLRYAGQGLTEIAIAALGALVAVARLGRSWARLCVALVVLVVVAALVAAAYRLV